MGGKSKRPSKLESCIGGMIPMNWTNRKYAELGIRHKHRDPWPAVDMPKPIRIGLTVISPLWVGPGALWCYAAHKIGNLGYIREIAEGTQALRDVDARGRAIPRPRTPVPKPIEFEYRQPELTARAQLRAKLGQIDPLKLPPADLTKAFGFGDQTQGPRTISTPPISIEGRIPSRAGSSSAALRRQRGGLSSFNPRLNIPDLGASGFDMQLGAPRFDLGGLRDRFSRLSPKLSFPGPAGLEGSRLDPGRGPQGLSLSGLQERFSNISTRLEPSDLSAFGGSTGSGLTRWGGLSSFGKTGLPDFSPKLNVPGLGDFGSTGFDPSPTSFSFDRVQDRFSGLSTRLEAPGLSGGGLTDFGPRLDLPGFRGTKLGAGLRSPQFGSLSSNLGMGSSFDSSPAAGFPSFDPGGWQDRFSSLSTKLNAPGLSASRFGADFGSRGLGDFGSKFAGGGLASFDSRLNRPGSGSGFLGNLWSSSAGFSRGSTFGSRAGTIRLGGPTSLMAGPQTFNPMTRHGPSGFAGGRLSAFAQGF